MNVHATRAYTLGNINDNYLQLSPLTNLQVSPLTNIDKIAMILTLFPIPFIITMYLSACCGVS